MAYNILYLSLFLGICHGLNVPTMKLLDGNEMPVIGLGTFQLSPEQVDIAVATALENGYRHFDAAFVYNNEKSLGNAFKKWFAKGGKREDIFITTKLPTQALRSSDVEQAIELSLNSLGVDYLDMYLIHLPFSLHRTSDFQLLKNKNGTVAIDYSTDLIGVWKEMEKHVKQEYGKMQKSNPAIFKQVEANIYIQQNELLELCKKLGIVMTGYSPLASAGFTHMRRKRDTQVILPPLIKNEVVQKIAKKYKKSPAQVALRYNLQRNIVVIPKSSNPMRIKENVDVFDFKLTKNEMNQLKMLDQHGRYRKFDFLSFVGIQHHPEYPFADRISKF